MPVAKNRPCTISCAMGIARLTVGIGKDFLSLMVVHKERSLLIVLSTLNG
jgi:hypothetical protein